MITKTGYGVAVKKFGSVVLLTALFYLHAEDGLNLDALSKIAIPDIRESQKPQDPTKTPDTKAPSAVESISRPSEIVPQKEDSKDAPKDESKKEESKDASPPSAINPTPSESKEAPQVQSKPSSNSQSTFKPYEEPKNPSEQAEQSTNQQNTASENTSAPQVATDSPEQKDDQTAMDQKSSSEGEAELLELPPFKDTYTEPQEASKAKDGKVTKKEDAPADLSEVPEGAESSQAPKPIDEHTAQSATGDVKNISFAQQDAYKLNYDDYLLQKDDSKEGYYVIKVLSLDLEAFLEGRTYDAKDQVQIFSVNNNFTQISSINGKIISYSSYRKKKNKDAIPNVLKIPLEKVSFDTYRIDRKNLSPYFDLSSCKITIKKMIDASLKQSKEVIMDLNIKRELRNTTDFTLAVECPR